MSLYEKLINHEEKLALVGLGYVGIGDFTEIGLHSHIMDDDKGTTRVWVHSEKGKKLLQKIGEEKGRLLIIEKNSLNIVGGPKKQIVMPPNRQEFFEDVQKMDYMELIRKWEPRNFKGDFVGIIRRIINVLPGKSIIFKQLRAIKTRRYHKQVKELNNK